MDTTTALEWDRLAALQPRLAADARIHRHCYRGVPWYVVQDGASAKHVRLGEGAWRIAGLMDGERTLEQIQTALNQQLGGAGPTRDDIRRVLFELHGAELIECDALSGAPQFAAQRRQHDRQRWRRLFGSPLSQRLPLFDPQTLVDRWLPTVRPLLSRAGLVAWLAVVLAGVVMTVAHWGAIAAGLSANILSPYNLAVIAVAYLVIKTLHEFGHAFATRAFGGEVHEMGVMFLVFVPVPYVDASASSAFPEKTRRMAVGAAGIMVEIFISVLALATWLSVGPGLVKELAFNVVIVGGLSTLFFNGNPLLRFDGYYVLCDALEIPNLGARSTRYLGYLAQRYLFGAPSARSPANAPGERFWFLVYGVASAIYRLGILFVIVLFVAQRFPVVGVVIGLWAVVGQLVLPASRGLKRLVGAQELAGRRTRAMLVLLGPATLALIGALAVPVPAWTYAEGIIWMPEGAQLRAGTDGFMMRQIAADGSRIEAGEAVFALRSDASRSAVLVLEQRLEEHQARYDSALFHDRASLDVLEQQLARSRAELDSAREHAAELLVRSPLRGTLIVPDARRLDGRHVPKGELLGYVSDDRPLTTRVVVRQDEVDRIHEDTRAVRVKLPGYLDLTFDGVVDSETPSATHTLPAASLGAFGGGRIAVDGAEPQGHLPAESVFMLDIILPADAPRLAAGTRVFLRFEHGGAPLAAQIARATRQLLLARFGL